MLKKKKQISFSCSDLLIALGYAVRGSHNRDGMTVKISTDQSEKIRRKTPSVLNKVSPSQGGSAGRQLVPGLLLVQQDSKGEDYWEIEKQRQHSTNVSANTAVKCNNNAEITKTTDELDECPTSPIDDSVGKSNLNVSTGSTDSGLPSDGVRPTDQLTYLAQILGFKVSI